MITRNLHAWLLRKWKALHLIREPLPHEENFTRITYLDNIPFISLRDENDMPSFTPRAFKESSPVRMAYLSAVLANVYGCVSVVQSTSQLNHSLDMLEVQGQIDGKPPIYPPPVRSLSAAKSRLGIDPDAWIVQYAICTICWKHYHPREINELEGPECIVPDCTGIIFDTSTDSKGRITHTPQKINPQVSLIESLRCMMLRPGFARIQYTSVLKEESH
ncbi:hypothetical protein VKT23_019768 [Stygiomarasmius scandens]|uniref:Uncharacterized protein n=1 Tax=Marasmiellus scandens TaxID=2682957 RepID=A0ABR1INQ3_9AGAR